MNNQKIIILSLSVLVMLSMMLFAAQLFLRKFRDKSEDKNMILSCGIWFTAFLFSGALLINKAIIVFAEAMDNINKINGTDVLIRYFKTGSLLSGVTLLWLIIWYYLTKSLSVIVTGKTNMRQEVQAGSHAFFLIRGAIFVGCIIGLLSVFEMILRAFIPHIDVPFYH